MIFYLMCKSGLIAVNTPSVNQVCKPCLVVEVLPMRSYSAITCAPRSRIIAAASRLSRIIITVAKAPYTTFTRDSVEKYQTRTCLVISHNKAAVIPPIKA